MTLRQESTKFSCKRPDGKYFRLYGLPGTLPALAMKLHLQESPPSWQKGVVGQPPYFVGHLVFVDTTQLYLCDATAAVEKVQRKGHSCVPIKLYS